MARVKWLTDEEQRAWRAYRRMRVLLDLQLSRDLAKDSDLSEPDYDVLSTLTEHPDRCWRATALARRLLWSTSRLAHHVGRMERRGLVRRVGSAEDGRAATVELTDKGWQVLQAAAPPHVASVRRNLFDLLSPAEIEALESLSTKVIEHIGSHVA